MRYLKLMTLMFSMTSLTAQADWLEERSTKYSDMRVKCHTDEKNLSIYLTARGEIFRSSDNNVTWAVYSTEFSSWQIANKKYNTIKNLHSNSRYARRISHKDPFGYEYEIQFAENSFLENEKTSQATLTRTHEHPEVNTSQTFDLNCITTVNSEKIEVEVLTAERFDQLSTEHQSYLLNKIAGSSHEEDVELTSEEEDRYEVFHISASSKSISEDEIDSLTGVSPLQKTFLKELEQNEAQNNEACIEDRVDWLELSEEEKEEVLGNWNICSYTNYVVRDAEGVIIGFVVDRYNDNGTDEYDSHDGSVIIYNAKGEEIDLLEWEP